MLAVEREVFAYYEGFICELKNTLLTGEELPDTKLVYTIVLGVCYRFDLYLLSFGKTSVKGKVVRTFQKK